MKYLLIVMIFVASVASATNAFWVKLDPNNYVIAYTTFDASQEGYIKVESVVAIPRDILSGCYKWENGSFVLDDAKLAEWNASQIVVVHEPDPVTSPDAIGGE